MTMKMKTRKKEKMRQEKQTSAARSSHDDDYDTASVTGVEIDSTAPPALPLGSTSTVPELDHTRCDEVTSCPPHTPPHSNKTNRHKSRLDKNKSESNKLKY